MYRPTLSNPVHAHALAGLALWLEAGARDGVPVLQPGGTGLTALLRQMAKQGVACRFCRQLLAADVAGCEMCAPIRPHLVGGDEVAEDDTRPALSEVAAETVRFLRDRARWYKAELQLRPGAEVLARGAIANANAITKMLESARKLQADGLAAVSQMSFVERAKLFVEWYTSLPPTYRARLREQLARFELDMAKPLPAAGETSGD